MIQGLERYRVWRFMASGLALAAGLVACTSMAKKATSCVEATDCGGGAVCRDGICQATFTVALVSPAGDVATSGHLAIQVRVDGYEPPEVLLLVGDRELARVLRPNDPALPYTYDWDTSELPEGTYALKAVVTAGWQSIESRVVQVVVDRTKPTVVARMPAPGASNIWSRDPITVTFSEPIALPPAGAVTLVATSPSGAQDDHPNRPRGHGSDPHHPARHAPPVPSTLLVGIGSQVTDLAGNSASLSGDTWSWSLPEWQQLGSATPTLSYEASAFNLVVAPGGTPFFTFWDGSTGIVIGAITVRECTGSGGWISRCGGSGLEALALDADPEGRPVIAWNKRVDLTASSEMDFQAGLCDGNALPTEIVAPGNAGTVIIKADGSGRSIVAWLGYEASRSVLLTKVRSGAVWEEGRSDDGALALNSDATASASASNPQITFDGDGSPRLTWMEGATLCSRTWSWARGTWSAPARMWMSSLYASFSRPPSE